MNLNDMFGPNPQRPDTKEFWALSDIVLKLDGRMDAAGTDEEKNQVFEGAVTDTGMSSDALAYMGMQRAFRAVGVQTRRDLDDPRVIKQVMAMTALYMEAFIVGSDFAGRAHEADAKALDQIAEVAGDLDGAGGFMDANEAILAILTSVGR